MRNPHFYDTPAQMEPLVINSSRPLHQRLIDLAQVLAEASVRLDAAVRPATAKSLSALVTGMNCYYSNLIEGHKTLPIDIDAALHALEQHGDHQHLQSLALAHIETEHWARQQSLDSGTLKSFLLGVHQRFCQLLPTTLLQLGDGSMLIAGEFRSREVSVGRHVAPSASALAGFIDRYVQVYGQRLTWAKKGGISKLDGLIAAFAAHHRLVWIHPFLDGNGRVARIALDAMLRACGVNNACLWSMSRGFAKSADEYKARLAGADASRRGDLDGRGNLSEKGLAAFCEYAMQTAIDQARFMDGMFALEHVQARAHAYFHRVRFDLKPESAHLYIHAFGMGEFERGEASRLTGLPERTARLVLSTLLAEGLLVSDSPKGKVRAGFPVHALGSLLPNLYPAGDVDCIPPKRR